MSKTAITYGTFDMLHYGHIELLRRARGMVGKEGILIVGLSTDDFNTVKGKKAYHSYEKRKELLNAVKYVDQIIPENSWDQKSNDIKKYQADILIMGDDWKNSEEFRAIKKLIKTKFLSRTPLINSTDMRKIIKRYDNNQKSNIVKSSR